MSEALRSEKGPHPQIARDQFFAGLHVMSYQFDALVENFAACAAVIADSPSTPAQLQSMMEFAIQYYRFGLDTAVRAIDINDGVPVEILKPQVQGNRIIVAADSPHRPGTIIGLVGAERIDGRIDVFDGVAQIESPLGLNILVPVLIKPDGMTVLHPSYVMKPELKIEQIFPK